MKKEQLKFSAAVAEVGASISQDVAQGWPNVLGLILQFENI
jgi:hypothetical protein